MKKIISNFIYQAIYQLTLIILPIITIPIVSHSLGADGIGKYNFVTSVALYFTLTAGLGLSNYGIREIAQVENNKKKLSIKFWELEYFNLFTATIVTIVYMCFVKYLNNNIYFLITTLNVVATIFDISWFYYGVQDFKKITLLNTIIKIISFILIVYFIKGPKDLNLYFLIQSGSILVSNLSLWIFLPQKIDFIKPKFKESIKHFKTALHYFLGKISVTLYTTLNKTLLGVFATSIAVGLYSNSIQISLILVTLIGVIDTVLMPHMTKLVSEQKQDELLETIKSTIDIQLFFSIPLTVGLVAINNKLVPWFFGSSFSYLVYTVPVLSIIIILIPIGISIEKQYLMPLNKITNINFSVIIAAILSILINILFIERIGIWATILATIISELWVTVYRIIILKKNTEFKFNIYNIIITLLSSIIMFIVIRLCTKDFPATALTTIIQIVIGGLVYFSISFVLNKNHTLIKFLRNKKV